MALRLTEQEFRDLKEKRTPKAEKRLKYGNKIIEWNGIKFHSKKELARYQDLLAMQQAGQIVGLERQKEFGLKVEGMLICSYVADFVYQYPVKIIVAQSLVWKNPIVVEDVKSPATRRIELYRIKKKLVLAVLGIEIKEY